jgi:hypothetical protein
MTFSAHLQVFPDLAERKTGDTAQHRSGIRGDALRLLETQSGIRPAKLSEIRRRQTREYRRAAELLAWVEACGQTPDAGLAALLNSMPKRRRR